MWTHFLREGRHYTLSIFLSALFVAVVAHAASTISTNIQTDGTLSVTGVGHFTGDINVYGADINLGTGSATSTLTSASALLGVASTSPWGLFSIDAAKGTVGENTPTFVVGDAGTSTPFFLISGNDGNVGVGTSSPWAVLSVNAPAGKVSFAIGSSSSPLGTSLLVDQFGLVGFSSTSPAARLSLTGLSAATTPFFLISTSTATATSTAFVITSSGALGLGTTTPYADLSVAGKIAGHVLDINSRTATSTFSAGALIGTQAGNVGIGTTSPRRTLSVAGTALIGSSGTTTITIDTSSANTGSCIELRGATSSAIYRIYIGSIQSSSTPLVVEAGSCRGQAPGANE